MEIKVYTAGTVDPAHEYRFDLPDVYGVEWLHPVVSGYHIPKWETSVGAGQMKTRDILSIQRCDVLLAVFTDWKDTGQIHTGTSAEIGMAYAWQKQIICVMPTKAIREQRHFVAQLDATVVSSLPKAIAILEYTAA